ncbi:MAG: Fic family protein [Synergistaceae bacterium]|nr:Fic family protein [Synergistaceae bacterium]
MSNQAISATVYLHPFADGNGSTVRLLTALLLIRAGYEVNKYFVLDDYYDVDRPSYSDALHSADAGDSTIWVEYFTSGIKYSLQSALAKIQNSLLIMRVSQRPSKREQQVLELLVGRGELTSMEVAQILGVSRQQAQNLLSGLVRKSLIKKIGKTKNSYYRV